MKEAAEYIESLPDYRRATITAGYTRLEDRRRKAVPKERHKEFYAQATCLRTDEEIDNQIIFITRHYTDVNMDKAIELAVNELKEFINS